MTDDAWIDSLEDGPDDLNDDLPWRRRLAKWPDLWRERWGHRANALEDAGLSWIEAERQAWNEVLAEKRQAERPAPAAPTIAGVRQMQTRFKESA